MCGIAGATRELLGRNTVGILQAMNDIMLHRGPDMGEIYSDDNIGLCHRRLSIIDLTEDGRQPMFSEDQRYVIVFNGEIYNYLELRSELEARGYRFFSKTDTEVLLYAYIEYGPDSLKKLNGMFAYAIWDTVTKKIFIACDRLGKKPLYYFYKDGKFAFASELKSLLAIPSIKQEIDLTSLADYFKYLFVPHPKSIYKNICKLSPGHHLTFKDTRLDVKEYWDVDFSIEHNGDEREIVEELLELIKDSVKCRLISDVPLGAFLSGGIDSSGIVALMNQISSSPVTTCTIGFQDSSLNEAEYAKEFARSLHTEHHEHYVTDEPESIVRKLIWHFDEPFADSSMVPTYYVSKMARENVTVALSGDGGDENFAGYQKYLIDRFENRVRRYIPPFLLEPLALLSGKFSANTYMRKVHSLTSTALRSPSDGFYVTNSFISDEQLHRLFKRKINSEIEGYNPAEHLRHYYQKANGPDHLSKILYTDIKLLLPGDFLVKVDRMSMANSLEVRSPLLDYRLVEFAANIPSLFKIKGESKKYILKNTFKSVLPKEVLERKKQGFESPVNHWFRRDLRAMAETAFFKNEPFAEFINIDSMRKIWTQHLDSKGSHGALLWTCFIFALWLENEGGKKLPEVYGGVA